MCNSDNEKSGMAWAVKREVENAVNSQNESILIVNPEFQRATNVLPFGFSTGGKGFRIKEKEWQE